MAEARKLDWQVRQAPHAGPDLSIHPAPALHPAWQRLIRFCSELGHGELEKLKIQDGLPVLAEVTTRKVKFGP